MAKYSCKLCKRRFQKERDLQMHKESEAHRLRAEEAKSVKPMKAEPFQKVVELDEQIIAALGAITSW